MRNGTTFAVVVGLAAQLLLACAGAANTASLEQATGAAPPPPPPEQVVKGGKVLLVVGDARHPEASDELVRDRLSALGFTVSIKDGPSTKAGDALGQALVVVSSTIRSKDLAARLRDVAVPVVTWEYHVYDDMALTGPTDDVDLGRADGQRRLDVADPSHPIAQIAGLGAGSVAVTASDASFRWGKPAPAARVIAKLSGSSSKAGVFAYDKGAALASGQPAAARRVGLFLSETTATQLQTPGWRLFDAAILWASGLTLIPPPPPPAADVLFVVGNTTLGGGDAAARARIEALGLSVALIAGPKVVASHAAGRKLVVISGTVTSATVGDRLRNVTVPIVTWEDALFDDLGFAGTQKGTDWDGERDQTEINVVDPSHPIAVSAGLGAQNHVVVTEKQRFRWARPAAGARVAARLKGSSSRATVFTFDAGAPLVGGAPAPARRVGLFLDDDTAKRLSGAGQRLFDAAIVWAVGGAPPPVATALFVVGDTNLSNADRIAKERITALGFTVLVRRGPEVGVADAAGKELVVISSTTTSADVGARLRDVAVGTLVWEPALFDDMALTGLVQNTDWGSKDGQDTLDVKLPAHPIAVEAGLSAGPARVANQKGRFRFGKPTAAAAVIATLAGDPQKAAVFAYEPGDALFGGVTAPARRVGFFLGDTTAEQLSARGQALFDAAVRYAAGGGGGCVPSAEVCNGKDDDCDGMTDEGVTTTFYRDADGDGFGNALVPTQACQAPAGYVMNATDCNDATAQVRPGAPELCNGVDDDCDGATDEGATSSFYRDADADGFGNVMVQTQACQAPAGYVANSTDCNDQNPAVFPGQAESCNAIDDDCDAFVDEGALLVFYRDQDGDGFGSAANTTKACQMPAGFVTSSTDCNDQNAAVFPGAPELCNGVDDDCDAFVDEGALLVFYRDQDGDGVGVVGDTTKACTAPTGYAASFGDCDDQDANVFPGAPEKCNGKSDDCDLAIDEDPVDATTWYPDGDSDGYGRPEDAITQCDNPSTPQLDYSDVDGDCKDELPLINPGAIEECDGIDQDCDGDVDDNVVFYADGDDDGWGTDMVVGTGCATIPPNGAYRKGDCNDFVDEMFPGNPEVCDGFDNDCNGKVDDKPTGQNTAEYYLDADGDGYGDPQEPLIVCVQNPPVGYVPNDDDCDDTDPNRFDNCN
jgi:uncharacterized protein YebE (UPF0316 family)